MSNDVATFSTVFSTVGSKSITAVYSGDTNNAAATSNSFTVNVVKQPSTTSVTVSPNPVQSGQPLSVTATVTANNPPTGTVCFIYDGGGADCGHQLTGGTVVVANTAGTAGTHTVKATYAGDANTESSEATLSYTVSEANTLPAVILTAPSNDATFIAPAGVVLTASASDSDGTIAKVEFFNGASLLATVTQAPYSYTWNDVAVGSYAITAVATDNLGATATSTAATITVSSNTIPTVSVTAPTNDASFIAPANITLTADAADSDGSISEVAFYHGDTFIGSTTSAPYSISWSNVVAGSYQIKAVATDNLGGIATSETVNFQVAANTPSTVSLSAEASSATAPGTIDISAQASDTDGGVAKVEIFNGTSLLVTLFAAPYDYQWTNVPAGSYTLTARVTDGVDGTTTSDPVPVTIATGTGEEIYAIHTDHLNTPRQITDSGNNVVWEWDNSDPFGNNVPVSNAGFEFNLRFPGQYFDKETNLHYNYFRDYDPSTGRYIQSDPIGIEGGINTYAYVGGNPISLTDPLGLVPPSNIPPGVNLNQNVSQAGNMSSWGFYRSVKSGGQWDYKTQGRQYEDFGNYNFGVVGRANGWTENALVRGAGAYQKWSGTSKPQWG